MKHKLLILALVGCLGACGVRGNLEVPPPLWGNANPGKAADTLPDDQVQTNNNDGTPDTTIQAGPVEQLPESTDTPATDTTGTDSSTADTPSGG